MLSKDYIPARRTMGLCHLARMSAVLRRQPCRLKRGTLARRNAVNREFFNRLVEQPIKIELCGEMQEHAAETDRCSVHEHEFAGDSHRSFFLEGPMNPEGLAPAVFGRLDAVRDGAFAVVEQRPIDEPRPDVEGIDQLARKTSEPPCLVGMHHQRLITLEEAVVEIDHAADEFRGKDTDTAVVEQVDSVLRAALDENRVIAEMRVAMDHAEAAERLPPRLEPRHRDAVARRD